MALIVTEGAASTKPPSELDANGPWRGLPEKAGGPITNQSDGPNPWGRSLGPPLVEPPSAEQGQLGSRSLGDWRPQGRIDLPAKRIPTP